MSLDTKTICRDKDTYECNFDYEIPDSVDDVDEKHAFYYMNYFCDEIDLEVIYKFVTNG